MIFKVLHAIKAESNPRFNMHKSRLEWKNILNRHFKTLDDIRLPFAALCMKLSSKKFSLNLFLAATFIEK